jgi:TolB-like protein
VLPLRSLSADSSPDYLADGVTEALIGRLASIGDLRVISHTSVMRFKNPQISVPEIAKKLDVDAIVEGSVMREGSNEAPGSWSANRNPLKPNCRA